MTDRRRITSKKKPRLLGSWFNRNNDIAKFDN